MRSLIIVVSMLAALGLGACVDVPAAAPPAAEVAGLAPPTYLERTMLGLDADDPTFLERFRQCARWASYTYCQADLFGGLTP